MNNTAEDRTAAHLPTVPWAGLGQSLPEGESIDAWRTAAGLDFEYQRSAALFMNPGDGALCAMPNRDILLRSDNQQPLSIVSNGYRIVQPKEILEFYSEMVKAGGFAMETAGSLKSGRIVWALARATESARIMGQDEIKGYLLLATSCDASLATVARFVSLRVVCNNMLEFAVRDSGVLVSNGGTSDVRVPHTKIFDPNEVKAQLGLIGGSWKAFVNDAQQLAERRVSQEEAVQFFLKVAAGNTDDVDLEQHSRAVANFLAVYENGVGQETRSANGTAWGLVNAVTRFYDHERNSRTTDSRLASSWFGDGRVKKARAFSEALKLVA